MDKPQNKHIIKILRQSEGVPKVSIVLPVFNSSDYIHSCIDSILQQELQDYELIIIDDGSTDSSIEKLLSINDRRITLISCRHNFVKSLNVGLSVSRGEFIARMDIDDKMLPNRLKEQVFFLDNNGSERGIRKLKIKLKNSCAFRSDFGADAFLELHSIVETAKKHDKTPYNAIQALFKV